MAEDMSVEVVPGMADAIENRRIHVGLAPGAFAAAAGITAQGLTPVRKGYRREYQLKVKKGVAKALRWPPDAIDRLMAGEDPATFEDQPDDDDLLMTVLQELAALRALIEERLPDTSQDGG